MNTVRWGVLSTAKIGREKVIPAMQEGRYCEVVALASRSLDRAEATAEALGIPKAFSAYEDLLEDPEIDAVYIPLPNHLHVPWTLKALEAGKHVLCEKPLGLTAAEAQQVVEAAREHPHLKVMEAFMYRYHPQWQHAKELVDRGAIGELRTIHTAFSYFNADPTNIRNQPEIGGGALMDIGCYGVSLSRFLFGREPERVVGEMEADPELGIDCLTSAMLDFGKGTATFTCATQLIPHQRVDIFGTEGRIEIEIPFNAPPDRETRIWLIVDGSKEEITFEAANQYTLQGDFFSRAVLDDTEVPMPIEDAVEDMKVIEGIVRSADSGAWVRC